MMRGPRSLRVRLQLWHALILLCVVISFGSLLYRQVAVSRWDEVDSGLLTAARVLEGALRDMPRPVLNSLAQDMGLPRGGRPPARPQPGSPLGSTQRGAAELDWEAASSRMSLDEAWESSLQLPAHLPQQLGDPDGGPAYYIIWREDGSILKQQDVPYPRPERPEDVIRQSRLVHFNGTGPLREVRVRGPNNTRICVGRPVGGELRRLWTLAAQMILAGATILGAGLCGGWWLSRSAVEPIERMTLTAENINSTNLSQRIDLANIDRELEQLGQVLNAMLGRLEQSFNNQQRFAADASHELRTPLATILSTIELSLSKPRQPEEYQQQLLKCQRAALRMNELVASLLQLTRSDARALAPAVETVDLAEVVQEAIEGVRDQAASRSIAIEYHTEPLAVVGHTGQLLQVVTNLLQNAIKYNRDGGSISLRASVEDQQAILVVSDTGIGIDPADLPHIFDRFYRVDKSRSQTSGHGLGLAICQAIVETHGGVITATSQPGEGSVFKVRLNHNPTR